MRLRSLLFVPGDRPERFAKAEASGADAVILDLEDSVAPEAKAAAREAVAARLASASRPVPLLVRINPLDGPDSEADLAAIRSAEPDGLVLPKAEGAASIRALRARAPALPVLPIATETPAALFRLGGYAEVADALLGLTWGAEDLPAAIGAVSRHPEGGFTPPFEMVRALALFAAHAAGVPAIDTVVPAIGDPAALDRAIAAAVRDGFTGMMAIHPTQVAAINAGFTPDAEALAEARAILAAFAAAPGAGALRVNGRMVDRPHRLAAERLLARAGDQAADR
ncbi:HpcH/HpaI aldolase/citrate lyase family protein [Sphingomonas morindae]|uniref:CoA ester lyase n=1 Tax=Sphingomonas morindae TaxID=1541170 RepID=A0ABY4XC19_9SPHN|nr:CoA ester lyase [Sphingomonas morindae]USI74429.1 CoA ester lyase [Sphingomonas morindae]